MAHINGWPRTKEHGEAKQDTDRPCTNAARGGSTGIMLAPLGNTMLKSPGRNLESMTGP